MGEPNILKLVEKTLEMSTEEILQEMLETSISSDTKKIVTTVKNWEPIAAFETYVRIPVGFGPARTREEIRKEYEIQNNICRKKDYILQKLKDEGIFADWFCGSGNSKNFTAVTVIDQNYDRLMGTLDVHYAFKSIDEALVYVECFKKLYEELMLLAKRKKDAPLFANKLDISIVVRKEEVIKVCNANIEND